MKTGDFLNKLATKSGIAATDKHLIDVLSKSEFANHEIPDDLVNAIDSALMTEEAAKSNPNVIKKIKSETLNGADSLIERLLTESGYDEADIAEIKADKNTFSRIEKMAKTIKTLEGKKAVSQDKDKAALQKQIDDLNSSIRQKVADSEKLIEDLKKSHTNELTNAEIKAMLASKKFVLPDDMDPRLKNNIALSAITAELKSKGLQIVNTNDTLDIKRIDGTDAYDASNRRIDVTNFIDGVLAQNKLLAVSNAEPANPANPAVIIPGQNSQNVNHNALAIIDQQMKDAGIQV